MGMKGRKVLTVFQSLIKGYSLSKNRHFFFTKGEKFSAKKNCLEWF